MERMYKLLGSIIETVVIAFMLVVLLPVRLLDRLIYRTAR